ncbi:ATP-binding protein [Nonomuraea endophytica]|uniref:ATP-binding protein n=1 Tax=Nonomuraea endophytica TaxID=714136 RepID=UPI0037C878C3
MRDPLPVRGQSSGRAGVALEDGLLGAWSGACGWMVLAEPLDGDELAGLAEETARAQRAAAAREERSARFAVEAERLTDRYRELAAGASVGLWRVRLVAGGGSKHDALRVAGLLCGAMDLDGLPYTLRPDDGRGAATFTAGTELVAALARAPRREVPGVRLARPPEFDLSPEKTGDGLALGVVLDRQREPAGVFGVAAASLNRHVFVCGATGAGKSQTVRSLLEAASGIGLPWLVVEPAKAEYTAMAARLPGHEVLVIRPGLADAVAAGLNPLEPAAGFPLQTHADLLRALFLAAFDAEDPFPQVLAAALTRCYEDLGWDLTLGEPREEGLRPRYPTLEDLQRAAERVVAEVGYGREVRDNVQGFIRVRLAALRLGGTGRFLQGGHPIDFERLLASNVVFQIEDVGDDQDKAFLMGVVLLRLAEHLRVGRTGSEELRHLTVIEEAHRLLRRTEGRKGAAAHAVETFASLLAEIRAYGEGLVVSEQIPAKLIPDVIKNTAVKIVHRLPAADDRDVVGATMNLSDAQSAYLVTLPPGEAAVFADGMDHPLLVRMPDGTARERGPHFTADARDLVGARSATCPGECGAGPCTLRQMRRAQRLGETRPWLAAWAELSVISHLLGEIPVVPRIELLQSVRAMDRRLLDCALAHAVDDAVAARSAAMSGSVSPGALAGHVVAGLRARLEGRWYCAKRVEPEWVARDGVSVALGERRPGAVERAAGCTAGARGWSEAVSPVLADFLECQWPLGYLR